MSLRVGLAIFGVAAILVGIGVANWWLVIAGFLCCLVVIVTSEDWRY